MDYSKEPHIPLMLAKLQRCVAATAILCEELDIFDGHKHLLADYSEEYPIKLKDQLMLLAKYLENKGISKRDLLRLDTEINAGKSMGDVFYVGQSIPVSPLDPSCTAFVHGFNINEDDVFEVSIPTIWDFAYDTEQFYKGLAPFLRALKNKYPEKNLFPEDDFNYCTNLNIM